MFAAKPDEPTSDRHPSRRLRESEKQRTFRRGVLSWAFRRCVRPGVCFIEVT